MVHRFLYFFSPKNSETYISASQIFRTLFGDLGSKDRPLTSSKKSAKHGNVHAKNQRGNVATKKEYHGSKY